MCLNPPFLFVVWPKTNTERRALGSFPFKTEKICKITSKSKSPTKKTAPGGGAVKNFLGVHTHTHNRTKPCLLLLRTVILIRITRQTLLFFPLFPFECYFRRVQTLDRERYCTSSHRRMDCFIIPSERQKTKTEE